MYEDMLKRMKRIQKQLCELLVIERKMEEVNIDTDAKALSRLTDEMVAKSEKFTCTVRDFAANTFMSETDVIMKNASEIQGICVSKQNGIIEIEIPFILPKKKQRNSKFISDPLYYTLNNATVNDGFRITERAVICFIYVYSGNNGHITARDYDNIESKKILDTIALFALQDDGSEFCDVFHKMERGTTDKTRILIMPERCFWNREFDRRSYINNHEKFSLQTNIKQTEI